MSSTTPRVPEAVDVLIVGGGPTGLIAANLLGRHGVSVTLVEKNSTTSDEAKAISFDDESLRTLQAAGLDQAVYPIIVPGTGTRYLSASGKTLLHARGPKTRRHGHPFKNPFAQPDLEKILASGVDRFANVSLHFNAELVGVVNESNTVVATIQLEKARAPIQARYVLGCDGGRSKVRDLLGIAMTGMSFPDLWLVADTLDDTHDERYGIHVADPERPHVIVPGQKGRCRYEFKLRPGEATAGNNPPFELVRRLVSQYREIRPDQLERSVVYGFHALLADSFGEGRCFLLGDAAHMMPPFAGQGLNSGVRDAMNLCWKVAAVLDGSAAPALLSTYEQERRPHARATIDLSVRLGNVVMTSSRPRALVRDLIVGTAVRIPYSRRYLTEMRYRPTSGYRTGFLVRARGKGKEFVGTAIQQPMVLDAASHSAMRLDDILGPGIILLGVATDAAAWDLVDQSGLLALVDRSVEATLDDRSPKATDRYESVADLDGQLNTMLEPVRGLFLLIRPDRIIAAAFLAAEAPTVLVQLKSYLGDPGVQADAEPLLTTIEKERFTDASRHNRDRWPNCRRSHRRRHNG